jgi:hypothetical protein
LVGARPCAPQQRLAERGTGDQEDDGGAKRRADHRGGCPDHDAEEKTSGHGQEGGARQRQGNRRHIERDISKHGQDLMFRYERANGGTMPNQRLERNQAAAEGEIGHNPQKDDRQQRDQPAGEPTFLGC